MAATSTATFFSSSASRTTTKLHNIKTPISITKSLSFSSTTANSFKPLLYQHRRRRLIPSTPAVKCLFTGIVEEIGHVVSTGSEPTGGYELKISASEVVNGVHLGDSIAVNGACLTVSDFNSSQFTVGLSPETLRRTNLEDLRPGSPVNLERAVLPSTRMGGHFVQGHIDATGVIVDFRPDADSLWVKIKTSPELLKYIVPKGFIAVDGTSLTVVGVYDEESCFDFMLVAYTQQKIVIPMKKPGDKVNLEVDILGKYVEKLLRSGLGAGNTLPESGTA